MAEQIIANTKKSAEAVPDGTVSTPKEFAKRIKNAISTNIGLYEIRMNLFLWDLFRVARQKEN